MYRPRKPPADSKVKDVERVFKAEIVLTQSFIHFTVHTYFLLLLYSFIALFTEKPFSGVFNKVKPFNLKVSSKYDGLENPRPVGYLQGSLRYWVYKRNKS